jgi:hypothetical protein
MCSFSNREDGSLGLISESIEIAATNGSLVLLLCMRLVLGLDGREGGGLVTHDLRALDCVGETWNIWT